MGPHPYCSREVPAKRRLPKSDNRGLSVLAEKRLRRSSYPELRNITCENHGGVLTLRGRVPSYFLKQLAQETVRTMAGVATIANQVHVTRITEESFWPREQVTRFDS